MLALTCACGACDPPASDPSPVPSAAIDGAGDAALGSSAVGTALTPSPAHSEHAGKPSLPDGLEAHPARTADPVAPVAGVEQACPPGMVLIAGEYCPGL
ncbi:MAG: hypothetical protein CVU63_14500, partial [Deltaproteobacteria bacterium HGW-Deltaproteobacteria-20]